MRPEAEHLKGMAQAMTENATESRTGSKKPPFTL